MNRKPKTAAEIIEYGDKTLAATKRVRELVKKTHPSVDLSDGQHAHEAFQKIGDVIEDLQKRLSTFEKP